MDRVPQERVYLAWPSPAAVRSGRCGARCDGNDPQRRSVVAASKGAHLRQAACVGRGRLPVLLSRSPACSWCRPPRVRACRSTTSSASSGTRSHGWRSSVRRPGAEPRQDEARIQLHHGPRADRRLRRQGGPAQPIQHVSRRSREIRMGPPALSRYRCRCRKGRRRALARYGQTARDQVPSRDIVTAGRGRRSRSFQEAGDGAGPAVQDAGRANGKARKRPRRSSWSSDTIFRRLR